MAEKKSPTKKSTKNKQQTNKGASNAYLRLADSQSTGQNSLEGESFTERSLVGIAALRQSGVELDAVDEALMNFMEAAYSGQTDNIPALMEKLAEAQAQYGTSISELEMELFNVVAEGDIAETKRLIAAGVNVNARDDFGNTPLHIAIEKNFANIVYWLLQAGADPNIQDELDRTALELAQEFLARYQEIIRFLTTSNANHQNLLTAAKKANYTPRQGQILAFIYHYTKIHKRPPAEADIGQYFKLSPPSVHQLLLTLEKHGFISKSPGQSRSIKLLITKNDLPDLE